MKINWDDFINIHLPKLTDPSETASQRKLSQASVSKKKNFWGHVAFIKIKGQVNACEPQPKKIHTKNHFHIVNTVFFSKYGLGINYFQMASDQALN